MKKEYFVSEGSVVRRIWGSGDTILFIFAGAAAEFALNKAVDWLYFTGKLPADPLGRLFSTVSYARAIVFSERHSALRAIDSMATIHSHVEAKRKQQIPDWAYRDVLFLLIDYSIRSFEVLERKMSAEEKNEVFQVFNQIGLRMGINGLPQTFTQWMSMRNQHLRENLRNSHYTTDLFKQYRRHLGSVRYRIMVETQKLIVPAGVRQMLGFRRTSFMPIIILLYKLSRVLNLDWILKELILPSKYKKEIRALDSVKVQLSA
jgi:hypothetical protein